MASGVPLADRAITTVELGAAPLEYYLPPLHNAPLGATVRVSEIDETGYPPLVAGAGEPPAPGFRLVAHRDVNGLVLYRFLSVDPAHGLRGDAARTRDHGGASRRCWSREDVLRNRRWGVPIVLKPVASAADGRIT